MEKLNERLYQLCEEVAEKKHLQSILRELNKEKEALEWKIQELEAEKEKEDLDVAKLEGRSLAVFFYQVIGKLDEKLTEERREAYEAAVKLEAAMQEFRAVTTEIEKQKKKWSEFGVCELEYERLMEEKEQIIRNSDSQYARDIHNLEMHISSINANIKEIAEAEAAGEKADALIKMILESLDQAEDWSLGDMLGGGLITDAIKYSHLDDAQSMIEELQIKLRSFKIELADIAVHTDLNINIDGFTRFADYFFDGLFADWAVLDEIGRAKEQADYMKRQINQVLWKLYSLKEAAKNQKKELQRQINQIIQNAK